MPPLPIISGHQCVRALQRIGYRVLHQRGSHIRLVADNRPPVTVPLHDELDRGTLRSIIRMVEITVDQFLEALK